MPPLKKQNMHMRKMMQERLERKKVLKINDTITQTVSKDFPINERVVSDFKVSSLLNRQETLFNDIRSMTDDSKSNTLDLFDNMRYHHMALLCEFSI